MIGAAILIVLLGAGVLGAVGLGVVSLILLFSMAPRLTVAVLTLLALAGIGGVLFHFGI